jgi:transcriptional regulator GlxA family with amidase domain
MEVKLDLIVILFNEFETLDVFGPIEVLGKLDDISKIHFISLNEGPIISSQQVPVITSDLKTFKQESEYILLIPGGMGIRKEVDNKPLLEAIKKLANGAKFILTVCTGSLLLAKTGILNNKKATTNKRVYSWVIQQGIDVKWVKKARWVRDENIYTSSGVTAGIDMALGFIADNYGEERAESIAKGIEYIWNKDSEDDIFSLLY